MMPAYARVIRRSAAVTAPVAVIMIGISVALGGVKGVFGALIGVGVVTVFFGISVVAVGRAARVSPQVMMAAAVGTYIIKIIALGIVLFLLQNSTAFSARALGLTALACILVWSGAQVVNTVKLKMLYVDPDGGRR
jgi:ATP synthase protein I